MLVGMIPILAQPSACTGPKMEQGRESIPYSKRSKVGGEGGLIGLLCSRNARSRTPLVGRAQWETNSGHPLGNKRASLVGPLRVVHTVIQELQRRTHVVFRIEGDIETGLGRCDTKHALGWAVLDQEDRAARHHYRGGYQQAMCRARK